VGNKIPDRFGDIFRLVNIKREKKITWLVMVFFSFINDVNLPAPRNLNGVEVIGHHGSGSAGA
jgi:hypothetical protein